MLVSVGALQYVCIIDLRSWTDWIAKDVGFSLLGGYFYCLFESCSCTFMIWSPTRRPSSSAGLPSWTPAMKMPTSFPPASRKPTLSPFWKLTIIVFGLREREKEGERGWRIRLLSRTSSCDSIKYFYTYMYPSKTEDYKDSTRSSTCISLFIPHWT